MSGPDDDEAGHPLIQLRRLRLVLVHCLNSDTVRAAATLLPMTAADLPNVIKVAQDAMPPHTALTTERTFSFHFACAASGIEDGRRLFVLNTPSGFAGFSGLYATPWGPPENVWLSWVAIAPVYRGAGLGNLLISGIMDQARQMGFSRMFIETYAGEAFAPARRLYEALGFEQTGRVDGYLADGSAMLVYHQPLTLHDPIYCQPADGTAPNAGEDRLFVS